jgi:hypothetical protein
VDLLQRCNWNGSPIELGELIFVMRKGRRESRCKLFSHQFGWELRSLIGERGDIMLTKVCRSQDEVIDDRRAVESRDDREGLDINEARTP